MFVGLETAQYDDYLFYGIRLRFYKDIQFERIAEYSRSAMVKPEYNSM